MSISHRYEPHTSQRYPDCLECDEGSAEVWPTYAVFFVLHLALPHSVGSACNSTTCPFHKGQMGIVTFEVMSGLQNICQYRACHGKSSPD